MKFYLFLTTAQAGLNVLTPQDGYVVNSFLREDPTCWDEDARYSAFTCCSGKEFVGNQDCWDGVNYTYYRCCLGSYKIKGNARCWDGDEFTYENCCSGEILIGNSSCWIGDFNYRHCCITPSDKEKADIAHATSSIVNGHIKLYGPYIQTVQDTARSPTLLATFRKWLDHELMESDPALAHTKILYNIWSKGNVMPCYHNKLIKANFWPRIRDNWQASAAYKLDRIGQPTLLPSTIQGVNLPHMSNEVAHFLMVLSDIEKLLEEQRGGLELWKESEHFKSYLEEGWEIEDFEDLNPPISIGEVGGGFGGLAILALDIFDEIQNYTVVDLPQVNEMIYTLASQTLSEDKLRKLHFVDATADRLDKLLEKVSISMFISTSAYSEFHPLIRRMYFEGLISQAKVGYIVDNSYLQWHRGLFDLKEEDRRGGFGMHVDTNVFAGVDVSSLPTGVKSRFTQPVRQGRDVLVGMDLVHHLSTQHRVVDMGLYWREIECRDAAFQDTVVVVKWTGSYPTGVTNPASRLYTSDEMFTPHLFD